MKLLLFFVLIFPCYTYSQEALSFTNVVEVPSVNKDELFVRAREWFNENFKSSKDVLQIADKESGELLGKGIMEVNFIRRYLGEREFSTDIHFQMNVWVKDGKFKYEITNFISSDGLDYGLITTSNETKKTWPGYSAKKMNEMYLSIKQGAEAKAKLLIEDLKLEMSKKSKSSDW